MEKNKTNKKTSLMLCISVIVILLTSFTSAFGVSSHYWNDNPLKLAPGESTEVVLGLQNMVGGKDINFEAALSVDEGITASLAGESNRYLVPFGTKDRNLLVNVNVPEEAKIGETYNVVLSLKQVSEDEGGFLQVAGSVTSTIPVEVVSYLESPKRTEEEVKGASNISKGFNLSAIFVVLAVLIAAALIVFLFVRIRKRGVKTGKGRR